MDGVGWEGGEGTGAVLGQLFQSHPSHTTHAHTHLSSSQRTRPSHACCCRCCCPLPPAAVDGCDADDPTPPPSTAPPAPPHCGRRCRCSPRPQRQRAPPSCLCVARSPVSLRLPPHSRWCGSDGEGGGLVVWVWLGGGLLVLLLPLHEFRVVCE